MTHLDGAGSGRVGFVGLGTMGGPMCRRLAECGFTVLGYDTDPRAVRRAARTPGVVPARSPGALAGVDRLVTMLPDGRAVQAALLGPQWNPHRNPHRATGETLVELLPAGAVVVDASSSAPADTIATGEALARRGIRLVDAPVSGSPHGAGRGELTLMVGGDAAHLAAARGILDALGAVHHVGALGAGHALKALNNLLSAVNLAAAIEVLVAAEKYGIDPETALGVINRCTGRNDATERKIAQFVLSRTFDSGFRLRLMAKDIRVALDLVTSLEVFGPLAQACGRLWEDAVGGLPEDADNVAVAMLMEQRSGLDPQRTER